MSLSVALNVSGEPYAIHSYPAAEQAQNRWEDATRKILVAKDVQFVYEINSIFILLRRAGALRSSPRPMYGDGVTLKTNINIIITCTFTRNPVIVGRMQLYTMLEMVKSGEMSTAAVVAVRALNNQMVIEYVLSVSVSLSLVDS